MSRTGLLALGLGAFVLFLAATVPLRVLLAALPPASPFAAERVSGVVWAGVAERARFGAVSLGDVALSLDPLSLFALSPKVRFRASGAARGDGAVVLARNRWALEQVTGATPLSALGLPTALAGDATFTRFSVDMREGRCVKASGEIATDAFATSEAALGLRGPAISGPAACAEDGSMLAEMTGSDAAARIRVRARLSGDGRLSVETLIAPANPALGAGLTLAGFAPGPEGFTRLDEGGVGRAQP